MSGRDFNVFEQLLSFYMKSNVVQCACIIVGFMIATVTTMKDWGKMILEPITRTIKGRLVFGK